MNIFHAQTNYKELYRETAFGKQITAFTGHRFFQSFGRGIRLESTLV